MDVAIKPVSPLVTGQVAPQTSQVDQRVGAGIVATPGLGDNLPPPSGVAGDLGAALASIIKFAPNAKFGPDGDDPEVIVAAAMSKIADMQERSNGAQIKSNNELRKDLVAVRLKQAQDAIDQLNECKDTSIWDTIKTIAEVVVSVVAIYIGIGLQAVPGAGTALGALLIAGGVCGLISATDTTLNMTTGHGIAGNVYLAFSDDKDGANDADTVFGIMLATAQITIGIATCLCGDPQALQSGLFKLSMTLGTAAGDATVAVINYENAGHQAAARRAKASEETAQATIEQLDQYVQEAIKHLIRVTNNWGRILEDTAETQRGKANATMRIRFA